MHNFNFNFFFLKEFPKNIRDFFRRKAPLNRVPIRSGDLSSRLVNNLLQSTFSPPRNKLTILDKAFISMFSLYQYSIIASSKMDTIVTIGFGFPCVRHLLLWSIDGNFSILIYFPKRF